jgi:uncharacterized membrane protein
MIMTPRLRKIALTVHIITSVGWLGAVVGFLALAVAGLTSQDAQMVRATSLAMELTAWWVIVPFAFAGLFTGLVSSFFTPWGLFRYWWVLVKFLINVFAIIVLLRYMQGLHSMAGMATESVAHSSGALLFLLVATTLSVYKPRGMTRYGWRKQHEQRTAPAVVDAATPARPRPSEPTPLPGSW